RPVVAQQVQLAQPLAVAHQEQRRDRALDQRVVGRHAGQRTRRPRRSWRGRRRCRYGNGAMLTGDVSGGVGAAVTFTTWSITPEAEIERSRMACSRTPSVTGTSNAREAWMVGSTLKKQYTPSPQPSCEVTPSPTLYEAKPSVPLCFQAAWFGGS